MMVYSNDVHGKTEHHTFDDAKASQMWDVSNNMDIVQTIVSEIDRIAAARGISIRTLTEKAGVSVSAVSDMRTATQGPRVMTLVKLADALGVSPVELMGYKGLDEALTPAILKRALSEVMGATGEAGIALDPDPFGELVVTIAKTIRQSPDSDATSRKQVIIDYAQHLRESDDAREDVIETQKNLFSKGKKKR